MKKIKVLFICLCTGLAFTGCKNEDDTAKSDKFVSVANSEQSVKIPDGVEIVDNAKDFVKVTENQEYVKETDFQIAFGMSSYIAETDKNYYLYDILEHHIYSWDKETKQINQLCSKPECNHTNNDECDAFMEAFGIYYYEDNLYSVGYEREPGEKDENVVDTLYLYKISENGSIREKVCKIATCYGDFNDAAFSFHGIMHRGYLYYTYIFGTGNNTTEGLFYNNNSNILFRVKIDGTEEPECIKPLKIYCAAEQLNMKACGSYIYFCDNAGGIHGDLYRYNTESNVLEKMNTGEIYTWLYTIYNGEILYKKDVFDYEIYVFDPENDTSELFIKMPEKKDYDCGVMSTDGKYLYVQYINEQSKTMFMIMDENKKIINQLSPEETGVNTTGTDKMVGGMGDYFIWFTGDVQYGKVNYVKKEDFTKEKINYFVGEGNE